MKRSSMSMVAAAACTFALLLTGCSSGDSADKAAFGKCEVTGDAGSVKIKPVTEGQLTVATNLPSPAWWQGTSPETIDGGYEYCLAANVAHRAGLQKLVVKNVSFDGLVAGQVKDFDIALAQTSITEERKKVVDFSEPYYNSMIGVLVKKDADVTEANLTDKQLGTQVGTTAVDYVKDELNPTKAPRTFQDTEGMMASLQAGQIDAAVQDTAIVLGFAKQSGGSLKVVGQFDTGEKYGAIFPKDSPNTSAINDAITAMKDDGTLDKLSKAWLAEAFGADPNSIPQWTK